MFISSSQEVNRYMMIWVLSWSDSESIQAVVLQDAGEHKCLTLRVFGNVTFMCLTVISLQVRCNCKIPWAYEVYEHSTQPFLTRDFIRNYKYIFIIIMKLWIPGQCFSLNTLNHSSLFSFFFSLQNVVPLVFVKDNVYE